MSDILTLLEEVQVYKEAVEMVMIKEYQTVLNEYELTSKQTLVIQHIFIKKQLTINEVAGIINATKSAASQFIKKLENKNYVKREVNLENRRETFVKLAEKGETFHTEMLQANQRILEKFFMNLPKKDIEDYHRVIKKLYNISQREMGKLK